VTKGVGRCLRKTESPGRLEDLPRRVAGELGAGVRATDTLRGRVAQRTGRSRLLDACVLEATRPD